MKKSTLNRMNIFLLSKTQWILNRYYSTLNFAIYGQAYLRNGRPSNAKSVSSLGADLKFRKRSEQRCRNERAK